MMRLKDIDKLLPEFIRWPDQYVFTRSRNYVVLDFETTNKEKGSSYNSANRIIAAGWRCGPDHPSYQRWGSQVRVKWGSEYELDELLKDCEAADFVVAHNSKFEIGWLARAGLDTSRVLFYCTQLGEYVLAGNRKWELSLEATLARYGLEGKLSTVSILMKNGVCPSDMPREWVEKYLYQDVTQTYALFERQVSKLADRELLGVQFSRCIFTPVLVDIESRGMFLDKDRVIKLYQKANKELAEALQAFNEFTGGINTRSTKQKVEYIYGTLGFPVPKDYARRPLLTKNGKPKTDMTTLRMLRPQTRAQRQFKILLLNVMSKQKPLDYLKRFFECVNEHECVLTASFNQTITGTHRLSSSGRNLGVQFQNFPRNYKPLFKARNEGWFIGEGDEAQLEFRTAVELSGDSQGFRDIQNKVDCHRFTADVLTEAGEPTSRQDAKPCTFKPLYGGTSGTPAQRRYYKAFRSKYRGITETQQHWITTVYRTRKLRTITGLTFYWTDSKVNHNGKLIRPDGRLADQSICNYPVQSFATADIVPIGITYQWHVMKAAKMRSFMTCTIHDSSITEVHPDERELFEKIVVEAGTTRVNWYLSQVYGINLSIPLEVEVKIAPNWADSEEWRQENL